MSGEIIQRDRISEESPQSLLERTLIAEYLLSNGYLMSDLKELPPEVVKILMQKACQYAALRLAEIESRDGFLEKIRLPH
jgi:hypothetical protein